MSGHHYFYFGEGSQKIFDLLIYRCQKEQYWDEQERDGREYVRNLGLDPFSNAPAATAIRQHWFEKHGGPWTFNEAVGLISIFAAPRKIGGLFYFPTRRVMKHMQWKRAFVSKLFEFNVSPEEDAATIYQNLRRWLNETLSELSSLRSRVVDLEPLETLGPHIDWIAVTHKRSEHLGR